MRAAHTGGTTSSVLRATHISVNPSLPKNAPALPPPPPPPPPKAPCLAPQQVLTVDLLGPDLEEAEGRKETGEGGAAEEDDPRVLKWLAAQPQ